MTQNRITLKDAISQFSASEKEFLGALLEGKITAHGVRFTSDDVANPFAVETEDENRRESNYQPIPKDDWHEVKLDIKKNQMSKHWNHLGGQDFYYYNEIIIYADEYESFLNKQKLSDLDYSNELKPDNASQAGWEKLNRFIPTFDKVCKDEGWFNDGKLKLTKIEVAQIVKECCTLTPDAESIRRNYISEHPYFEGKFNLGAGIKSRNIDLDRLISMMK